MTDGSAILKIIILPKKFYESTTAIGKLFLKIMISSTANGQMVINIMLSVNEADCDRTSERIKAVFDYKRSKGMCVTGMCAPYGYVIENGYIKKDPATQHVVEDAIQHYFTCFSIRILHDIS